LKLSRRFSPPDSCHAFSTVFLWVAIALASVISLPALWLCGLALWPGGVEKRAHVASLGLVVPFLIGLVPLVLIFLLVARLGKGGAAAAVGVGFLLLWGFVSADGLCTLIGRRVRPDLSASQPWKQTLLGGLVLMGSALMPVLGWVFILPILAVLGWGISLRSLFVKTAPMRAAVDPE
jgi:hypothetical protein